MLVRIALVLLVGCAPAVDVDTLGPDATVPDVEEGTVDGGTPPVPEPEPTLTIMTFNIRHGADSSLEEIAEVIRREQPDIVGLQEVDKEAVRSGGTFQSYRLGQLTGMSSLFRNAIEFEDGGDYGLALLSRYPIMSSSKLLLTSPSEQRVLVTVDVQIKEGVLIPIAITHLSNVADEMTVQAQEVADELADLEHLVLMGDFNADPDKPAHEELRGEFTDAWIDEDPGYTFPADEPARRIDMIYLSPDWATPLDTRVIDTQTSDHRPLMTTLSLPLSLR